MAYHVLQNSRIGGTRAFPCETLTAAVTLLGTLAQEAEERREQDGVQRYFCIVNDTAPVGCPSPEDMSSLLANAVVVLLKSGLVPWVGSDITHLRIIVCDADSDLLPYECEERMPEPLSEMPSEVREALQAQIVTAQAFLAAIDPGETQVPT